MNNQDNKSEVNSASYGPRIYTQNGPNGLPVYVQTGADGQPIYYQIGQNGQPIFLQLVKPAAAPPAVQMAAPNSEGTAAPKSKPKKKKKKKRIVLFFLEILLLIILAIGLYVAATWMRVDRVQIAEEEIRKEVQQQLPEQTSVKLQGYWNIAMYGIDARSVSSSENGGEVRGQSDTIMICSIDKATKEVKLASVYRDSYLDCDGTFRKATDVYAAYGVEKSIRMLNRNLDLDITDFVTVNMKIVADVVNAIGGIEVDVETMEEVGHLNNYQVEGSEITGLPIIPVEEPGLQLLNGLQAMSYCRIRYTAPKDDEHPGLDYERTQRQRIVLEKILEKVKTMDYLTVASIINKILPNVSTSLSAAEILELAKGISSYRLVDTCGWPYEKQTADTDAGDCVIPVNLAQNVTELQQFLFPDKDYEVSPTVQEISNNIANNTGIY